MGMETRFIVGNIIKVKIPFSEDDSTMKKCYKCNNNIDTNREDMFCSKCGTQYITIIIKEKKLMSFYELCNYIKINDDDYYNISSEIIKENDYIFIEYNYENKFTITINEDEEFYNIPPIATYEELESIYKPLFDGLKSKNIPFEIIYGIVTEIS